MAADSEWTQLLAWLATFPSYVDPEKHVKLVHNQAGRGLVAHGNVKPNTLLISIPHAALLNLRTLRPLYPKAFHTLTATQLLSLHLARQFRRHLHGAGLTPTPSSAKDPHDKWWPFIATLPRSFATVPLWWAIHARSPETLAADFPLEHNHTATGRRVADDIPGKGKSKAAAPREDVSLAELAKETAMAKTTRRRRAKRYAELREAMPPGVRRRAEAIEKRFEEDWLAVRRVWNAQTEVSGEFGILDFAMGFLNVNTRCIWFAVDGTKENNMTLCPVTDMINHAPLRVTKPEAQLSSLTFSSPSASSPDPPLRDGDELAFSYGPHEDAMLLAEYGFVVGPNNEHNAVEIDRFVEALFDAQEREGQLKRELLEQEGYWGDMTLQSGPDNAPTASWRVLVALRLLQLRLPAHAAMTTMSVSALSAHDALAPWYHVLSGATERVSAANEKMVAATLRGICGAVLTEAERGRERCEAIRNRWPKDDKVAGAGAAGAGGQDQEEDEENSEEVSLDMLETVWREEARIAKAISEASA